MIAALEYIELLHVFLDDDDGVLFEGTPDRVMRFAFFDREDAVAVIDYKLGRIPVQSAESNLQLRAYLTSVPDTGDHIPESHPAFRPSNLLRRKMCPGSLALESKIPPPPDDDDGTRYAEEGRLLHSHLADRTRDRRGLLPEQWETLSLAEEMEVEFLDIIKAQMKPGWGYGAIVQPRISNKPFIVAYSPQDLQSSRREIIAIWHAAHADNAPRHASEDACRHCRATAICEEHKSWVMAVEKIAHLPAYAWSPQQWDLFLSRRSALTKFIDERYEEAKAIKAADPDKIPGWDLKDGAERRVVTDVVAAFQRFQGTLTAQEFSDCCKLSIGAIEEFIWKKEQSSAVKVSQKEVKRLVNAALEGIAEIKKNKPSLVKSDL